MEWIKIKRDKDGFATDEVLDKMYKSLPIIVVGRRTHLEGWEDIELYYETKGTWDRGEYERHTQYTEYAPCNPL